jgi:hypothetical protein
MNESQMKKAPFHLVLINSLCVYGFYGIPIDKSSPKQEKMKCFGNDYFLSR